MGRKEDKKKIYDFTKEEMILRDLLAADRTLMASKRTLLAYIRTSIRLLAVAISLIKLFDTKYTYVLGVIFIISSVIPVVVEAYSYKKIKIKLKNVLYK